MKFLRAKAAMISIVIVCILCSIAAGIAIEISIVMIKKQHQTIKPQIEEQNKNIQVSAKPINANKLEEYVLYFNGQIHDGMTSFSGTEENSFIPVDILLKTIGVKFKYFASDDILEFGLNGKKVIIKINSTEVIVGGEKIELKLAVQAAKNHILVPTELMEHIGDFGISRFPDKKSVFINYFPELDKYKDQMKVLKTSKGVATISDFQEDKYYWKSRKESMGDDRVLASDDGSGYIIKALDKVFLIRDGQEIKPQEVNADISAAWSADGKLLYWVDKSKSLSYCYRIDTGTKIELGNYYERVLVNSKDINIKAYYENGGILYDYKQGKRFKRVVLTNDKYSSNYTFIERRGRTFVEGPVSFSPDHSKILFYEMGKGYYSANNDGSNKNFLGPGTGAKWINNDKIILAGKNGMYTVSNDGKDVTDTGTVWKKLGETPKGDVLYTDGNLLYSETNGKETKLQRLVVSSDYVFSADVNGPYIAVSNAQDKVYLINSGTVDEIGNSHQLLKGKELKATKPWGDSILSSPNGTLTSIARNIDGFINIDILDNNKGDIKSLTLNHLTSDTANLDKLKMKWMDDTSLIVFTPDRGWLVKVEDGFRIYNWIAEDNEQIKGILLK